MDSATLDVVYIPRDAWAWGWDAIVGLGTIVLALATFAIVWYSWRADVRRRREEIDHRNKRNCEAVNLAILQLIGTYQTFKAIQEQSIKPHEGDPARDYMILPILSALKTIAPNYQSLAFLLESPQPTVLAQLSAFEQEVASVIETIQERNIHHRTIIQPLSDRVTAIHGEVVSKKILEEGIGRRNVVILNQTTQQMVDGVNAIVASSVALSGALRSAARATYPGSKYKIITFTPAPENAIDKAVSPIATCGMIENRLRKGRFNMKSVFLGMLIAGLSISAAQAKDTM